MSAPHTIILATYTNDAVSDLYGALYSNAYFNGSPVFVASMRCLWKRRAYRVRLTLAKWENVRITDAKTGLLIELPKFRLVENFDAAIARAKRVRVIRLTPQSTEPTGTRPPD